MGNTDCFCLGNNPNCERCFGRGYYNPNNMNETKIFLIDRSEIKSPKKVTPKPQKQKIKELSLDELTHLLNKYVNVIDEISMKQAKLLRTISLRKRDYYHNNEWKFDEIKALQDQKNQLIKKYRIILEKASLLNTTLNIDFKHPFSNIEINTNSSKWIRSIRSKLLKRK